MFTLSVVRAQRCVRRSQILHGQPSLQPRKDRSTIQKQKGHSHDLLPFDELFKVV